MVHPIKGEYLIPGDKSISHRALILAANVIGRTTIYNVSNGQDVGRTAKALRLMGVHVNKQPNNIYIVSGVGVGGLSEPQDVLNMGNSGTAARLFTGLVASYSFVTFMTGDESLRSRPMEHVIFALRNMCVDFIGESLPLGIIGSQDIIPMQYTLPIPSAQLKSAILLAALNTQGTSTITENPPFSRDHTEIMLQYMNAPLNVEYNKGGSKNITLVGQPELFSVGEIHIPADPSQAAFIVAAALIIPGSDAIIKNVCINPTRTGFYDIARSMGAAITFENERVIIGEKVADIRVKHSTLHGISITKDKVPAAIDEFPILSILAAYAQGNTKMIGLQALRTKESNRIESIVTGLKACGVHINSINDEIIIQGNGTVQGGVKVKTFKDHRIAMSFIICGLMSKKPITIDNAHMIKTSFPDFFKFLKQLTSLSY